MFAFFLRHVPRSKDCVTGVIERPDSMKKASFRFHLAEERRSRIGREDVKSGPPQPVLFDPFRGAREDVFAVVVESENERAVHLDAIVVQHAYSPRVVGSLWRFLVS